MAEGSKISPEDLEFGSTFKKYAGQGLREARDALDGDFIQRAISRNNGNITQAAAELGVSRPTLYEMMEKLGIGKEKG